MLKEFIDKTVEGTGTPFNRSTMMALQGFQAGFVKYEDGKIIETNSQGHTLTTSFEYDSANDQYFIREVFEGEKTISKISTLNQNIINIRIY